MVRSDLHKRERRWPFQQPNAQGLRYDSAGVGPKSLCPAAIATSTLYTPDAHRYLTVVPLQSLQRYYGECPASIRRVSRPVRGGGRSGRQPVRGQRLACLGRRLGSAVSTKTPAKSKGESPSTVRPLTGVRLRLAKSGRRWEFKLYLALTPSRHVSALRNLMLVLSMV